MSRKVTFASLIALLVCGQVRADTFVTPTFVVIVINHCEDGFLGCKDVSYFGINRRSGANIVLKGFATTRSCAGTNDICEETGYMFRSGDITYEISRFNVLTVTRGSELLLEEQGRRVQEINGKLEFVDW